MPCAGRYGAQLNSLWSIWYCVLTVLLHAYLVYAGIERYRLYADLNWHNHQYKTWLIVYGCIHAAVVCMQPVFIACAFFKIGNISNDNERLGSISQPACRRPRRQRDTDCCSRSLTAAWRHAPPLAPCIHCLCALALLLAQQFMLAQLLREPGMDTRVSDHEILAHELDIFFDKVGMLRRTLPFNLSQHYRIPIEALSPALENGAISTKLLPILVNYQLFGFSLEFINFVVALLLLSIIYPSVFWHSNKVFSLVFAFHLALHLLNTLFAYIAFSLLFRFQTIGLRPFVSARAPFLMPREYCVLGIYLIGIVVTFLASICVYAYGYNKFFLSLVARRQIGARSIQNNNGSVKGASIEQSMTRSVIQANAASHLCCEGYGPHIAAIVMLVLMVCLKAPIMYDLMVLYQNRKRAVLFACIVADVVFLFWWIILWLALTLKRDWPFRVAPSIDELVTLLRARSVVGASDEGAINRSKRFENNKSAGTVTRHGDWRHRDDDTEQALLVVANDEAYYTSDTNAKYSVLRTAHKCGIVPATMLVGSDVGTEEYWLTQGAIAHSPANMRRAPQSEATGIENSRLLDSHAYSIQRDEIPIPPNYQTLDRDGRAHDEAYTYGGSMHSQRTGSQQPAYGTQQRQQTPLGSAYAQGPVSTFSTLPRGPSQQPSYGHQFIHDGTPHGSLARVAHANTQQYGTIGGAQVYARPTPPQARVLAGVNGVVNGSRKMSPTHYASSYSNARLRSSNHTAAEPNIVYSARQVTPSHGGFLGEPSAMNTSSASSSTAASHRADEQSSIRRQDSDATLTNTVGAENVQEPPLVAQPTQQWQFNPVYADSLQRQPRATSTGHNRSRAQLSAIHT